MIFTALLISACGVYTKREWLAFFFDGVPAEKTAGADVSGSPAVAAAPHAAAAVNSAETDGSVKTGPAHRDLRCDACHESQVSQKCHDPVLNQ